MCNDCKGKGYIRVYENGVDEYPKLFKPSPHICNVQVNQKYIEHHDYVKKIEGINQQTGEIHVERF